MINFAVSPTATITVPDSPGRVEEAEGVILNGEQPTASVSVKGVNFPLSLTSMKVKRGSIEISSTSIVRDSASELTVEFGAGKEETSKAVQFGERYEMGFTVPVPAIVESTSTVLNSTTNEHFKVIVNGMNFEPGTEWILKLTSQKYEIFVTMKTDRMGESSWVKAGGSGEIGFGKTYTLSYMPQRLNDLERVVCKGVGLTTPTGPTLTEIKAELNPSNLNEGIVSLTVSPCAAGDFTLIVFDSSDRNKTEISIGPFSFAVSSTPTTQLHRVMIDPSETLWFGKTYTVKTLSSSTLIVSHVNLTLKVPDPPARISFATPTLSGMNKTLVTLSLTGEALPCGKEFGIVVKEMDRNSIKIGASEIVLTGTIGGPSGSTSTTCTTNVEIYTKTGTLEYSKKYKIISLSIVGFSGVVDSTVVFTVPDSPGRVEAMKTPKLSGEKTEVSVAVTGVGFAPTISSIVVKNGDTKIASTSVTFVSTTELTANFSTRKEESDKHLGFEKSYEIESVSGQSEIFLNSGVGFTVPLPRIVTLMMTELNKETNEHFKVIVGKENFVPGTEWTLKLKDREEEILATMKSETFGESSWVKASLTVSPCAAGDFTLIVFDSSDRNKTEISIGPFSFAVSSTPTTQLHRVMIESSETLWFGKQYTVKTLSSSTLIVNHTSPLFSVPAYPTLTKVDFSFATTSNTTFCLIVEGTDLPVGETFLVSLDGFDDKIEVRFITTSGGSSGELALGWSDTLQFDTAYPLLSVIHKGSLTVSIPSTHLSLQPIPRPNPLIVFVSDSGTSDPKLCGAVERPCSSVDVSMNLIDGVAAQSATIKLIRNTTISNPITVEADHELKIELASLTSSTLLIPSTASLGDSAGLVSVAGTLTLKEVKIEVKIDAVSFVLFDVKGGELVMESVQISGVGSSSAVVDGIEGLSSWETGLIKLHESNCSLTSCVLSSIGMGEIWMESSNLSLMSTEIVHSGSRFSLFPSAQQDVMCESGNISIVPLSSDTSEDRWISSTSECSVTLNGSELKSPHFVPWIDVTKSKSTLSKKKDSFSVLIVGSKLIPCDLKLEVSELSSSSSNTDPVVIPLSFSSVVLWNETHINVSIAMSSLSSLSMDSEWTARIVFGNGEHTDSFTFLESLKVRRAHALRQSLPWLIPVIVCSVLLLLAVIVVVVVVICRRRRMATKSDSSTIVNQPSLSENEAVENSVEAPTGKASDDNVDRRGELDADDRRRMDETVVAMKCEGQFEMEMVDGKNTLFNRMHFGDGVGCGKRREIENWPVKLCPVELDLNTNRGWRDDIKESIHRMPVKEDISCPHTREESWGSIKEQHGVWMKTESTQSIDVLLVEHQMLGTITLDRRKRSFSGDKVESTWEKIER
ncbi:hypothetical protein BLNAU_2071 [Blattamonas nauphoetae]|uniref:IPT/TIG domain-containing protein n=1 Tax=Blattamonas nauphoetae TaxID=2049346 RepID=A0ABQ9YH18_9EUKA|nr:hypothetical protein BLNAU_2071 [Blattamonas nauphoetae]